MVSGPSSNAVVETVGHKVVPYSDPVLDSDDTSDTNFSFHPEFHEYKSQIGTKFGCVPLTPIYVYKGPPIVWNKIPDVLTAQNLIKNSGIPNFWGSTFSSPN